jgi:hypothetical protein
MLLSHDGERFILVIWSVSTWVVGRIDDNVHSGVEAEII